MKDVIGFHFVRTLSVMVEQSAILAKSLVKRALELVLAVYSMSYSECENMAGNGAVHKDLMCHYF